MPDVRAARSTCCRRRADQGGAAAVEFALVSVLLFTILFGIIQYGFFFFQLSSAQSLAAAAARQVETGSIDDCTTWQVGMARQMALDRDVDVSWVRTQGTGTLVRGHRATVTVDWTPIRIGAGLVPFPGSGQQRRTMEVQIDHLGSNTAIWGAMPGCPP